MAQSTLQGVACWNLDPNDTFYEAIIRLLDIERTSKHENIDCYDLKLDNKYYKTTISLFDCQGLENNDKKHEVLDRCQAIILSLNGQTACIETLDEKVKQLEQVSGEPRILLQRGLGEKDVAFKSVHSWSIENGYDLINAEDDTAKEQLIDSLSAYKWRHRTDKDSPVAPPEELNEDILRQLKSFDELLGKMNAYKDRPNPQNDPEDKAIEEMAKILSDLLSEDGDAFLDDDDDDNDDDESTYSEDDNKELGNNTNREGYERIDDTNHVNGNDKNPNEI